MKTMTIKMATNAVLSTAESKKQSKQPEQEQNHRYGDQLEGYQVRGRRGRMVGKVRGLRNTNWQVWNRQEEAKNSTGNSIAKELVCMTQEHELRGGIFGGNGGTRWRRAKGEKIGQLLQQNQ